MPFKKIKGAKGSKTYELPANVGPQLFAEMAGGRVAAGEADADAHLGRGAAKPIRRTRARFGLIQAVR